MLLKPQPANAAGEIPTFLPQEQNTGKYPGRGDIQAGAVSPLGLVFRSYFLPAKTFRWEDEFAMLQTRTSVLTFFSISSSSPHLLEVL